MHLHDELAGEALATQPLVHGDHCELDEVGRRALHRRVDRGALGARAARAAAAVDVGQREPTPEDRLDVALGACRFARLLHVVRHTGIAREILVDELLRGVALDAQLRGETEGAHAVDQPEVHGLGVAPLLGRDLADRNAEDVGCRGLVDVEPLREGIEQRGVL